MEAISNVAPFCRDGLGESSRLSAILKLMCPYACVWVSGLNSIMSRACSRLLNDHHNPVSISFHRVSKKPREMKGKKSKKISLKYTAARLHEKGVLLEIEDLQANQWVFPFCVRALMSPCVCVYMEASGQCQVLPSSSPSPLFSEAWSFTESGAHQFC